MRQIKMTLSHSTIVFDRARSAGNGTPFPRTATQSKNDCAVALRERLCGRDSALCFLVRNTAITGETRLDSHPHSRSERYLIYRMDH